MADNIAITAGTGTTIATDDVGGAHYQRIKLDVGADGAALPVSYTNPMPVKQTTLGETWVAVADAVALAGSKWHLTVYNSAAQVLKVRKLFLVNVQTTAVTGVAVRANLYKIASAPTGGTTVTPQKMDSTNAALSGVAVLTNPTATAGALLWPIVAANDEIGATQAFPSTHLLQFGNIMMEGNEIQELTLRQNEGFGIQQVTSSTVGSWAWVVVFTVEA